MLWGGLPFTLAALATEIIESNIERASSVTDAVDLVNVKPKEDIPIEIEAVVLPP